MGVRILIVTYYWPPSGGGGVQRWVKFAAHLKSMGCEPIIYTPENPDVPVLDESLLKEIPEGIEIIKRPIFEPYKLARLIKGGKASGRLGASGSTSGENQSLSKKLALWVRGNLFVPDARIAWVKPSVKYLSKWLSTNAIDAIITTGPPHSMHLIGGGLKKQNPNLKWIADFRDPWSDMDYLSEFKMGKRAIEKIQRLEASVVNEADKIIVTSEGAGTQLLKGQDSDKAVFIPNGWDGDDFPKSRPRRKDSEEIRIGHFGSLHGSRNAPGFWEALSTVNLEKKITLVFAGNVDASIVAELDKLGLSKRCEFLGNIPHKKSIEEMLSCDILLLIHNNTGSAVNSTPGKLFEYIATSLPIITICNNDGDLAGLLDSWGLPHREHRDVEGAKNMLHDYKSHVSINASPFTRKHLTSKLIEVLKSIQ
jgi:glycosyltransferase involved in cell wall biosynthesis